MTHRFSSMLPQKSDNKKMAAHASTLLSTGVRHEKVKKKTRIYRILLLFLATYAVAVFNTVFLETYKQRLFARIKIKSWRLRFYRTYAR